MQINRNDMHKISKKNRRDNWVQNIVDSYIYNLFDIYKVLCVIVTIC